MFRKRVELYAKGSNAFMRDFVTAVGRLFTLGCPCGKKPAGSLERPLREHPWREHNGEPANISFATS